MLFKKNSKVKLDQSILDLGIANAVEVEINDKIKFTRDKRIIYISIAHMAYAADVILNFDYYHSSIIPLKIDSHDIADFSTRALHQLICGDRSRLFYFSSFPESYKSTKPYLDMLEISAGETILDLGAYCGSTSIFFSELTGNEGTVVAIEPDRLNFETLLLNKELYNSTNIIPINTAIASINKTIPFSMEGNMGSSSYYRLDEAEYLNTLTIEQIEGHINKKIDVIKMDIEGAELELLENGRSYFANNDPRLIIEPHFISPEKPVLNTDLLIELLKQYGYIRIEFVDQAIDDYPLIYARKK